MRKTRAIPMAGALAILAATAAGCAVADPDSSQAVLHYSGGSFSSQNFQNCIEPGTRAVDGAGDYHFYYPAGQRTFVFSDAPGADTPPIRVSTKNQTELIVRGSITFTLNTDCKPYRDADGRTWPGGVFQRFHDTIGRHKVAYGTNGGEQQPDGWLDVVRLYVGAPAEKAMDNAGLGYNWQDLYNNVEAKNAWQKAVEDSLPGLINAQAGGPHFVVHNVQLQKPDVPDSLKAELEKVQAATLRQQTSAIDQGAAATFPGGIQGYASYQLMLAQIKALNEGRGVLIPQGSQVTVLAPGR